MTEVQFKVRFMDWRKGDKVELKNRFADKYLNMGVCSKVKPPKRKNTKPPSNKKAVASNNK